jgi:hypothetical protein
MITVENDISIIEEEEGAKTIKVKVPLPHKLVFRPYQQPLFDAFTRDENPINRGAIIWHRRAGKDKTVFNIVIAMSQKRVGLYLYFLPTSTQAKKVIWRGRGKDGMKFTDHIPKDLIKSINNTEMLVELKNGSIIQLGGADNYDAFMGTNPLGIVFSEYSIQDPAAYDYFRPIMAENGGWFLFDYTPRGRNHGYFLYEKNKDNPLWYVSKLSCDETYYINDAGEKLPVITKEAIQDEIDSGMDADMVEQEFYVSFDAAIKGAYFGKEMKAAWLDHRVCRVPIQPAYPTYSYWDIGFNDQTAIWIVQFWGKEIRLVGYYAHSGEGFSHYLEWITQFGKSYNIHWEEHWGPHDIANHEYMSGQERRVTAKQMGLEFKTMPRPKDKSQAIEAARKILPQCVFDKVRCEDGINALTCYQHKYDEVNKVFLPKPLHNWASNGSDAFQYLALSYKEKVEETNKPTATPYTGRAGWLGN